MLEVLLAYFERNFKLSGEDISFISSVFLSKKLKKGQILQREGELARYGTFVTKGLLRSYVIDAKGKEYIIQFAPENWWISDKAGMSPNTKAVYFIDAIEESDILLLDTPSHFKLIEHVPGYASAFQTGVQKHAAAKDRRIVASLTSTAEERYNDFLKTYPSIAQRVPQHMLASYLGITPETLSRVRKQLSRRK